MVFSSLTFLYAYLPVVLVVYYLVPLRWRNAVLFLVSLFFYGWGEPRYVFVMLGSIFLNWQGGLRIEKAQNQKDAAAAKRILTSLIVINLVILGIFKYADFVIENLNHLGLSLAPLHLSLPIGISFYTFQAMSYPIDLYRGETSAQHSFLKFGTYVTMFPQLIAGPIVRYTDIAKQLDQRSVSSKKLVYGIRRFLIGLCKKVLLANAVGAVYESIAALPDAQMSTATAWIGILCFTFQIYFDFSGYSDMAIGLGKLLGFDFLENFNYPYVASSVTDFWHRWHISLSSWFRDYVYIPLGGNRRGLPRQILNLLIVWMLTGFWHGASWNFVLWGLFYGVVLIAEKLFLLKGLAHLPKWVGRIYTMLIVMIAWVLFAFTDLSQMTHYLSLMFNGAGSFANGMTWFYLRNNAVLLIICILAATPLANTKLNPMRKRIGRIVEPLLVIAAFVLCTASIVSSSYNPFLYFRF
jgi:alginate O-acetyltransferase complex protein AlgI